MSTTQLALIAAHHRTAQAHMDCISYLLQLAPRIDDADLRATAAMQIRDRSSAVRGALDDLRAAADVVVLEAMAKA